MFKRITQVSSVTRYYHSNVISHYELPLNVGAFSKKEKGVGTAIVGAPACGDVMKLQIKVDPESNIIIDTKFKTFGCGSAIAASSVASEWIKGKNINEVDIKNKDIAKYLKLPPVKLHCSMLAEDAITSAVKNYQESIKQKN
jgi:Fe-S cluster assembly scaffold IscU|tara:strand:- start:3 stop:428 length:426 start_codon:yes stop_codon:yes gene_type:complete